MTRDPLRDFQTKTVRWLRQARGLSTTTLPGQVLEPRPDGGAAVRGFFARPSRAADLAYGALCAWVIGAVLLMLNLPGLAPTSAKAVRGAGYGSHALGVGCAVAAEVERRRKRDRALVELRTGASATPDTIIRLAQDAQGGVAWLVADATPSAEALARADQRHVRCFVAGPDGIAEVGTPPLTKDDTPT